VTADGFTLEVPADPAYVGTARIFASTLARHFEVADETVEDLKVAISEACSRALAGDAADRISIRVQGLDGRLQFEIEQSEVRRIDGGTDTPTPSASELATGLSLELVTALFEDAAVTSTEGGPVLRFSVP
jgi:serine/threonine-protein kinase RsbW